MVQGCPAGCLPRAPCAPCVPVSGEERAGLRLAENRPVGAGVALIWGVRF